MSNADYLMDLHANGVHVLCKMPTKKWAGIKYVGDGTHRSCVNAGAVERWSGYTVTTSMVRSCANAPRRCGETEACSDQRDNRRA